MHLQRRPQSASPATSSHYKGLYTSYGFLPSKDQPQLAATQQPHSAKAQRGPAATTFGQSEKMTKKHPFMVRPQTAGASPNRPAGWGSLQPPLFTDEPSASAATAPEDFTAPHSDQLPVGSAHQQDGFSSTQQLWNIAMGIQEGSQTSGGASGAAGSGVAAGMRLAVAKAQAAELSNELEECREELAAAEVQAREEEALKEKYQVEVLDLKEQLKIRAWNLAEKTKVREEYTKENTWQGSARPFTRQLCTNSLRSILMSNR